MKLNDLLKGKFVDVMTDARVVVSLQIENIEEKSHSEDLEPPSISNDFYPPSRDWTTIEILFTNGFKKSYRSLTEINLTKIIE